MTLTERAERVITLLWRMRSSIYPNAILIVVLISSAATVGTILTAVGFVAAILLAYALSLYDICFTQVAEGTAVGIVRGKSFNHFIMSFRGHYLNDPRKSWFDPERPGWEVLEGNLGRWSLLSYIGVYWYGLWPFYGVYEYTFDWSEPERDSSGAYHSKKRREKTRFIYISNFVYWMLLREAEDKDNVPINLEYLLTVRVNNPFKALFENTSWVDQVTANANNAAKVYVGGQTFEDLAREKGSKRMVGGFVEQIKEINVNLPTDHTDIGAPARIGVTVVAASLQNVILAGPNADNLTKAMTATIVAEKEGLAKAALSKGEARALLIKTEAEAQRVEMLAKAEENRIKTVFGAIAAQGRIGELITQMEAMAKINAGQIIWANNPFKQNGGDILSEYGIKPADIPSLLELIRGTERSGGDA